MGIAHSTAELGSGELQSVAELALEFGRLLMESGSSARHVENMAANVAAGLGAECVEVRVGYSSIVMTMGADSTVVTRMCKIGPVGANERLYQKVSAASLRIRQEQLSLSQARAELKRLVADSSRHPDWLVAVSVGVACAAFGRLMGVDWKAVGPIFAGASLGQILRRALAVHGLNSFISAAIVAFLGSGLCGLEAGWLGSTTVDAAMIATVLLLVPGVPLFNAQYDVLEGRPSLGSARALSALVMLVFMTAGVWLAESLFGAKP